MKTMIKSWSLVAAMTLLLLSCYTTQHQQRTTDDINPAYQELADLLRKEPGVDVKGQSPNYNVIVRNKGTILSSYQPLYVVDGLALGTSYESVARAINIVDVQNITVLKGSQATAYGSRGANGVIEIRLHKGNK
ncbi:MAG: TonB-dependent receptor plug domain-containing protein [Saprospiraceae bacterium]|nr:TonB-dependent receptor plug domain-containing protein [Saprospiraceae bacterium]